MTSKEYIKALNDHNNDNERINRVTMLYADNLPEIVLKIISSAKETVFLDDDNRMLSYEEIVDAEKDLHVNFKEKGMIPLIDCGDNDFIVYNFNDSSWSKINIVDETVFKNRNSIYDLLS